MTGGFRVESSEVLHEGFIITAERLTVRTPDGELVSREVARHPGAVAVVAVDDGAVVLVEQWRAALDANLIEIPAGKRDVAGEAPELTAHRELVEEVGLEASSLTLLGSFVTAAGFCDEEILIYFSSEHRSVPREVEGAEEAHSTVHRVPVGEIGEWMVDGRLTDAKTLIGLMWARERGLLD